jgi:alpha-L-fucosidase
MALFVVAALLSLALAALDAAGAAPALPTAMQLEYQAREVSMFMHFSMCTFAPQGGCEQDTACRKNPASLFDPTALNTTQWIQTAKALGAKEVCLTAHHTGGFALFQSNVTDYGVKESPYQGGKGDIVKEFTDSCRAFGISPCLYFINAWDCWEASRPGVTKESYLQKQLGMLTELMNRDKYGKIDRFWFDQYGFPLPGPNGAPGKTSPTQAPPGLFPDAWSKIVDHVHTGSPGTMMLPGPDGCINPGEGGGGVYPVINYVNKTLLCSYPPSIENGGADYRPSVDGQLYVPFESDLSIQNPGDAWFYHKGHVYDNSSNLWGKYLATAGRGSTFILNIPPNRSGIIPEEFVEAVTGVGDAVTASFGTNVGTTSGAVKGTCDGKTPLATITAQGAACTAIFFFCKANFV